MERPEKWTHRWEWYPGAISDTFPGSVGRLLIKPKGKCQYRRGQDLRVWVQNTPRSFKVFVYQADPLWPEGVWVSVVEIPKTTTSKELEALCVNYVRLGFDTAPYARRDVYDY